MKPFALARVLQLAERRSETLSRTVKFAHGVWLRARGRQVQLTTLRDAHIAQLAGELRGGVSAAQLQEMNRLQHAQAAEMQAAQAAIDAAHRDWQARLAEWMQVEQRVKALRLLEQRHLAQAAIQQRRIEQREHDELVELTHRRMRGERDDADAAARTHPCGNRFSDAAIACARQPAGAADPQACRDADARACACRFRRSRSTAVDAPADAPATPSWQPDAALATLWLTRRLGGQRVMGATSFVPHTLLAYPGCRAGGVLAGCGAAGHAARCAGVAHHGRFHAGNARRAVAASHNRHDALGAGGHPAWLNLLRQACCC